MVPKVIREITHNDAMTPSHHIPHQPIPQEKHNDDFITVPTTWVKGLVEWAKRMEERERHVLVGVLYKLELNHLLRSILEGEAHLATHHISKTHQIEVCDHCGNVSLVRQEPKVE
ncbi:MAG: hypothetical protein KGI50_00550 [Patescibacteria group bacterium]|nr:hypothetical protein [Patescibacteria group bacterium]MDE2438154.1 hypothetical protein [Patescibacteria group bacterium]